MSPLASVIVPAHNEAVLIPRLLSALVDGEPDSLEIVVVANGCSDDTAARARAVSDRIRLVEIPEASKIAALNAGDAAATAFPRIYLDADVAVTGATVRELAQYLASVDGPFAASTVLRVDASASSLPARAYFRVWEHSEYRHDGHIGSGMYGLNEAGRARFGAFPDVIADDKFVQIQFGPHERGTLPGHSFTVRAPRTLRGQVRRATRIARGNLELETAVRLHDLASPASGSGYRKLVSRVVTRPALWLAFPFYCYGYAVPRVVARAARLRGSRPGWNRDDSSRR